MIQFDEHIFQMGWNHHLEKHVMIINPGGDDDCILFFLGGATPIRHNASTVSGLHQLGSVRETWMDQLGVSQVRSTLQARLFLKELTLNWRIHQVFMFFPSKTRGGGFKYPPWNEASKFTPENGWLEYFLVSFWGFWTYFQGWTVSFREGNCYKWELWDPSKCPKINGELGWKKIL